MAENQWLSVAEVGEKVGIPVETIRRYIRSHGIHMKVKKVHKRYVIHDESVTVFTQIRELYADGKNIEEVEQALTDKGVPMIITVKDENDEPMTVSVTEELKRVNDTLNEKFEKQNEFNKLLLERLDQQQKYINESLNKRDQLLLESIRSLQEEKQARIEMAAAAEKPKLSFWARLFGKK
ncbi:MULTISPECIES: MerR family transcriptional regulator [Terrabacteria group]|uniref:MerR family transcriptional regulator n=1 Tax=Bacillati TaxID=1783272 RepID=UPI0035E010DD